MANRFNAAILPVVLATMQLAGCATLPTESRETIAAREEVLLEAPVTWGTLGAGEAPRVTWQGPATLLLTPTTLYIVHASTHEAISYATVTETRIGPVTGLAPPFRSGKVVEDQLIVRISRPRCREGCVFDLHDAVLARSALEMIEAQRMAVDPFGRRNGPSTAWLAAGIRNAQAWWEVQPEYLKQAAPDRKAAFDRWICEQTDCRGSGRTADLYGPALRRALPVDTAHGYAFRDLEGIAVTRHTSLDTGALVEALRLADPAVDRLLVSDLQTIRLRERISADYRVSIDMTFDLFVDYFDVDPVKDGQYFWLAHSITRPLDEWLAMDADDFAAEVAAAARSVACRIQQELEPHGGAAPDSRCVPRAQQSGDPGTITQSVHSKKSGPRPPPRDITRRCQAPTGE
ncbi:MAG TPA: hypothetical protein VMQ83_10805 [Gammaproteobacteria bacterium]|nr:hypothetical protein [Gammaproteobacteria bacterium]